MIPLLNTQKIASDFNDNEAVWRAFENRKRLRELFGTPLPLAEEIANAIDWQRAEHHARPVRAIGVSIP